MTSRTEKRRAYIENVKALESRGAVGADEALALARQLKSVDEFGYAWRLLTRVRASDEVKSNPALDLAFRQEIALCTYKDTHLNGEQRLVRALEILDQGGHLATSDNPETLGLAGAIHKRLWQVRNDKRELELSLQFYRRGHDSDRKQQFVPRQGYPGINAAFILDLLAALDAEDGGQSEQSRDLVAARHAEAEKIRREIVSGLEPMLEKDVDAPTGEDYWPMVTLAEAHFGLREFHEASAWLQAARKIKDIPDWEFKSTAQQLSDLARLLGFEGTRSAQDFAQSDAGRVLGAFLGEVTAGLTTAYIGKVGLALSGGGFRASLFHIGVLARLAELDLLRHIEVLSCVSGGSILGAHYYLALRKLLRDKRDADITQQDYIDLVRCVETTFLKGVQTNIRTRIAAEWITNLKMIFLGYSRTQRLGELYEKKLYREIHDGEQNSPRYISELYVVPRDNADDKAFDPRRQNWRRANKVPVLILNATSLNTGHNWQFTASWMGESPTSVHPDIDSNYRLRRLYYDDAPPHYRKVRLGTAVGASSCVPGLFEPVALENLYECTTSDGGKEKITVRLVDGGVHDNQGVVGLIEQDCDVMLVSDASGQMEALNDPSNGFLAVPLRVNSMLMSRVRDAEYDDLSARRRSNELRDLMFVHLKMDLRADPVNWVGSREPVQSADLAAGDVADDKLTPYRMDRNVQQLLAANRTDLDAWSEAEAYALMLSGYLMTKYSLGQSTSALPIPTEVPNVDWGFLRIDAIQRESKNDSPLIRILRVGRNSGFKVWLLSKPLRVIGLIIAAAGIAGLLYLGWLFRDQSLLTVRDIGIALLAVLVSYVFGKLVMRIVWLRQTLTKIAVGIGMSVIGFLLARLHLHVFNVLYLRLGKIERL